MIDNKNIILLDLQLFTDKSKLDNVNVVKTLDSDKQSVSDLYIDGKKHLLVVPDNEKSINKVKELKLKEFADYIQYRYYKRKIVVLYGNFPQKGTIFFRDRIIDENIKKGKTLKDIIAIYNDKNLFDKDFIKIEYEKILAKIRMREKE